MSTTITGINFANLDFYEIIKGSTFKGKIIIYDIQGVAQDITNYNFDLWWRRKNETGKVVKAISETSGITILDGAAGKFQIDSFKVLFDAGTYYYDLKITDDSGVPDTRMYGYLTVKENSTE